MARPRLFRLPVCPFAFAVCAVVARPRLVAVWWTPFIKNPPGEGGLGVCFLVVGLWCGIGVSFFYGSFRVFFNGTETSFVVA